MRRSRWVVVALAVCVSVPVLAVTARAQSSKEAPRATEVGISATEIHIAVVADVDNSIVPNLFKASPDAVRGFANYINNSCKQKNKCLAGRKVVVDFYDSKLNPNETTNAEIQACQNDVAMVGTSAVFLTSVDNMRNCKDSTGAVTGLPDIPFVTTALVQQCSDQSFPMAPPQVICSTKDQHPQTFQPNVGRAYYYKKKFGNDLHGVYIFGSDSKSARDSSFVSGIGQLRLVCCKSDKDFAIPGSTGQSGFTPIVQQMKSSGSNYAQGTTYQQTVLLRKEATLQGVTNVKVWDCTVGCYDKQFLATGGADVDGEYVDLLFLPFYSKAEQKANKSIANYVKYTGTDKVASFGAYAWAASIAFRDAVNATVKAHGVNGVTRKTIFEALNKMHSFNADGMFGTIDLAGRKTSPCHVLLQVKNGDFQRILPTKPGTFDCNKKYVKTVQLDVYG